MNKNDSINTDTCVIWNFITLFTSSYIVEKKVGFILYYLKLLLVLQRLYLIFNVVKLITALKDLISCRYPNLLLNFIIIEKSFDLEVNS